MATHAGQTHQTGREEPESRAFQGELVGTPGPQISVVSDADGDGFVSLGALAASLVQRLALKRAEGALRRNGEESSRRSGIAGGVGLATSNEN